MLYLVAYRCADDERRNRLDEVVGRLAHDGWNVQEGVWIIRSNEPAIDLRDRLRQHLDDGEAVIVALLAGHAGWHGFDEQAESWLLANL